MLNFAYDDSIGTSDKEKGWQNYKLNWNFVNGVEVLHT